MSNIIKGIILVLLLALLGTYFIAQEVDKNVQLDRGKCALVVDGECITTDQLPKIQDKTIQVYCPTLKVTTDSKGQTNAANPQDVECEVIEVPAL